MSGMGDKYYEAHKMHSCLHVIFALGMMVLNLIWMSLALAGTKARQQTTCSVCKLDTGEDLANDPGDHLC